MSLLHQHRAGESVGGRRHLGTGRSPSKSIALPFHKAHGSHRATITELVITTLHMLRPKRAFTVIPLTTTYGHLGDWVGGGF